MSKRLTFRRIREKVNKHFTKQEILIFFIALIVFIFFVVSLILALTQEKETPEPVPEPTDETAYFTYNNTQFAATDKIAVNPHPAENFSYTDNKLTYLDRSVKTHFGIDVSEHQNFIDWKTVKNAGVEFAIIRVGWRGATLGKLNEDGTYKSNIENAYDAGIDIGAYFTSQATTVAEAKEEAELAVELLKPYKDKITYPVVFDWEHFEHFDDYRTRGTSTETLTAAAKTFCDIIKAAGYTPMVYFNLELAYIEYDISQLADYDFWLAEFYEVPNFYYNYSIVQYTDKGTVDGITGDVDLDLSFVDYSK